MTHTTGQTGAVADYFALARPEHWIKHAFIVPGIILAWVLHGQLPDDLVFNLVFGLVSAALVASANYVLNEWLDRESDGYHPVKSARPAVAGQMSSAVIIAEYSLLAVTGLGMGALVSPLFAAASGLFLASGVLYNVRPLRTKDAVHLDVLTEAFNNPLRLLLGWAMVDSSTLPPSSVLLAYWMGGAFLMAVKRLAEYRAIDSGGQRDALALYRRSFAFYSEASLLVSSFVYALMAAFFLAVFVVKYRIEYLLALPFVALLFGTYLRLGLSRESTAQSPENLFREHRLLLVVALVIASFALLTWIDLPWLEPLTDPHYIRLPRGLRFGP